MPHIHTISLVLSLATSVPSQAAVTESPTEVEIRAVEQRFEHAIDTRDRAELERVLADPFVWIHALDGRVESRSVFIGDAVRGMGLGRQHAESSTFERTVAIYGDTAIVTSRVRNRFPNDDREVWFNQSRVYVRGSGGWKLAMGQGTRMYDGPITKSVCTRAMPGRTQSRTGASCGSSGTATRSSPPSLEAPGPRCF